ncbi:ABC transporter permease [Xinfangfangia sp. D13-10-4-6]|uniref:ABC transporter permease n=1 Tax=Pseudogemmobacter hezensis TaxID=2737662 RepID=UPI001552BB9C|nr:ABC transporter permease [Pseudogemmobacter hezensis]NPD17107.1 ABC transporter permease [Pseudogemmobacter hezensis]
MDYASILQLLDSTIRLSTPLLLACLAGLWSERAGIFDIGLEGKMLAAAMASATVASLTAAAPGWSLFGIELTWAKSLLSPVIWGLIAGILASVIFALIHGVASITFRGNQLISGFALNFIAAGLTVLVAQRVFGQGGRTPQLAGDARFPPLTLPLSDEIREIPGIGPLWYEVISGHAILVYVAFAIVPLTWWLMYRTRYGLRLRAVGENPAAVDTAGISVIRLRYSALIITGILCGIAGAYMSTALQAGFGRDMTAGRGYIALAALIFAKWRPVAALWSCLLFGFFQALALRPDIVTAVVQFRVPGPILDSLPYILTVLVLAGFIGKATPPRAGGEPYTKER